jgi:hypothetical protein
MFNTSPAAAGQTPAATPKKSDQAGEFTRMFESPLRPEPMQPAQGAPDPFAGRSNVPPPQAAPVGEFTRMFGTKDAPPQRTTPLGPPTPPSPGNAGATNAFRTPSPTPGSYQQSQPQHFGPSEFTGMMATPSAGLLAQAAAAAPVEQKQSFFKKYLPVILIFGALIVVLIIILIFFASRKH